MVSQDSLLVTLVTLVDHLPMPALAVKRGRGHPKVYSDRLFLKALVLMIVRHLHNVHELLSVLAQPTAEMQRLRALLCEQGRFPTRRTWERRLKAILDTLPAQIGCLGRHLLDLLQPWLTSGRAVAIDSTILRARGGVWHQKHREQGQIPHTSIDTEARLPQIGLAWLGLWLETACRLRGGRRLVFHRCSADPGQCRVTREPAPALLREVPADVRFVLGDRHYNTPELRENCEQADRLLVATHYGRSPHTDDGVEVRRIFHKLRSIAMENFNEHFKGIFDGHGQVPTKGLLATQRFALGAVFVYQLALLYRFEHDLELCVGLKAFLKAA